jgi:hypothetical protein
MTLLVGTDDGVYRTDDTGEDAARVLDAGAVNDLRQFEPCDGVFAATDSGLYHTADGGDSWDRYDVPVEAVHSAYVSPDARRLYAGTSPPQVYRYDGDDEGWERSEAFAEFPTRDEWAWGGNLDAGTSGARVVSLAGHPSQPSRVYAGVETVGVFRSDDGGDSWRACQRGLHADVHHLQVFDPETVVAATGDGLYRTEDAGRTWVRLDTGRDLFWFSYFHETVIQDGVLYTSAQDRTEARSDDFERARSVLVRSTDVGERFGRESYPGETRTFGVEGNLAEFVRAWAVEDGAVVGVTRSGRLLRREGDWESLGRLPDGGRALLAI